MKVYLKYLGAAVIAIICGFLIWRFNFQNPEPEPAVQNEVQNEKMSALDRGSNEKIVTKIIDGDTAIIEGGSHVRLLGIDADEKGYPCFDAARLRLEELVLGKPVLLEADAEDLDQYGRKLRYVFLSGTNINEQLVAEGMVIARFYPQNQKYKSEIVAAEAAAVKNRTGCKWSGDAQTAVVPQPDPASQVFDWQKIAGDNVVGACDAKNYIGQEIVVQGTVADVYESESQTIFLNFGKFFPDNCFSAVIFKTNASKFTDPDNSYAGKTVRVSGTVQEYQGKPEIILNDPAQIEVGIAR